MSGRKMKHGTHENMEELENESLLVSYVAAPLVVRSAYHYLQWFLEKTKVIAVRT